MECGIHFAREIHCRIHSAREIHCGMHSACKIHCRIHSARKIHCGILFLGIPRLFSPFIHSEKPAKFLKENELFWTCNQTFWKTKLAPKFRKNTVLPVNIDCVEENGKLLRLKYEPSAVGSEPFFATAERIQTNVTGLGIAGTSITNKHIMVVAIVAFRNSGYNPQSIARIQLEYKAKPVGEKLYNAFKTTN